ncbi:VanZ family protein [Arthrobacter sp. A5]|uniref:VanZ family protein n=1 Tax=Arthrobacter sp. A5 TaxID=576926 RepID=UPI003DA7EE65
MTARRKALCVLAVYLVLLALIAFWPTPVDRPVDGTLEAFLRYLNRHGVPAWVDYGFVEKSANVALFFPLGLLVALILPRRRWWLAILIGICASCCIELGQLLFLSARVASVTDILVNSLGAALGAVCAHICGHRLRARRLRRARNRSLSGR